MFPAYNIEKRVYNNILYKHQKIKDLKNVFYKLYKKQEYAIVDLQNLRGGVTID